MSEGGGAACAATSVRALVLSCVDDDTACAVPDRSALRTSGSSITMEVAVSWGGGAPTARGMTSTFAASSLVSVASKPGAGISVSSALAANACASSASAGMSVADGKISPAACASFSDVSLSASDSAGSRGIVRAACAVPALCASGERALACFAVSSLCCSVRAKASPDSPFESARS